MIAGGPLGIAYQAARRSGVFRTVVLAGFLAGTLATFAVADLRADLSVANVFKGAPFLRRLRWRSSVKSSIRAPDWPGAASPTASG